MTLRSHEPLIIEKFNGLWQRGDINNTPRDHFSECNNVQYFGTSDFGSRYGIGISQNVEVPLSNVKRIYNYPTPSGNTLIVLTIDGDDGKIYHVVNSALVYGPILTIEGMTDFAFVPYAGRGYISPFSSFLEGELYIDKGLEDEFLYVYAGNGTPARKAAGSALSGALTISNGAAGNTDAGFHLFAFVAETVSGYYTPPGAITGFTTGASNSVSFTTVPTSGDPNISKRHLVATKVITNYSGNTTGYQFYFVPNATIPNDTDTFLSNISFFDVDLLEDASYLLDSYAEIPAGAVLSFYHNRLILAATYTDISLALISAIGEPESIDQINGLIVAPLDGNPITNAQELRDILYLFKRVRTLAYVDNGDIPATWPMTIIDNAIGTSVHGIATVLDSGSSSVDSLIVCSFSGIMLFNGSYLRPELSWKIFEFWLNQDRNKYNLIQIINDPISQTIYIVIPDQRMLVGNYSNGMDAKGIRWTPWSFARNINTIAIVNVGSIVFGMDLL